MKNKISLRRMKCGSFVLFIYTNSRLVFLHYTFTYLKSALTNRRPGNERS